MKPDSTFWIEPGYWLGIIADALWAVILFSPALFGVFTGQPDFSPNIEVRLIMAIGGVLMAGWTILLFWAKKEPENRRFVILVTAFPVVFFLFVLSWIGYVYVHPLNLWIMAKSFILFCFMITSYVLSGKAEKDNIPSSPAKSE